MRFCAGGYLGQTAKRCAAIALLMPASRNGSGHHNRALISALTPVLHREALKPCALARQCSSTVVIIAVGFITLVGLLIGRTWPVWDAMNARYKSHTGNQMARHF